MDNPDISHEEDNPLCGDRIRFDIALDEDGQTVKDVRFSAVGCAISKASASMLTEVLVGQTLDEIKALTNDDVVEELGIDLGPVRLKCALLPLKWSRSAPMVWMSGSTRMIPNR